MKKYYAESELIINPDGSIFHLHIKPEQLANKIILVGDPGRVALVASHFDTKECEIESREFKTITGTYKGKRLTVVSGPLLLDRHSRNRVAAAVKPPRKLGLP